MTVPSSACCLQDYGKYGVTNMDDKQKLFRLIKQVSFQVKHATATTATLWQLWCLNLCCQGTSEAWQQF